MKQINARRNRLLLAAAGAIFALVLALGKNAEAGGFALSINSGHTSFNLGIGDMGSEVYLGAPAQIVQPAPARPAPPPHFAPQPPRHIPRPTYDRFAPRDQWRKPAPIVRGAPPHDATRVAPRYHGMERIGAPNADPRVLPQPRNMPGGPRR